MRRKSGWALAAAVLLVVPFIGCSNSKTGTAPTTGVVWAATQGDQKLTAYSVNLSSGAAGRVGSPVDTGVQPAAMTITPDNKTLFVANSGDDTIDSYTVGGDGSLTAGATTTTAVPCPLQPPPCLGAPPPPTCGQTPVSMAIDPTGTLLFVAEQGTFDLCDPNGSASGTVSTFKISGTGLTFSSAIETQALTDLTGTLPTAVAVAPAGNFVYVANQTTNTVQSYSYDTSTGALTLLMTYTAGTNPSGLTFSRCAGFTAATSTCSSADGNNLFVANSGSNDVSIFTACIQITPACPNANGSLTQLASSPVAAGISPTSFIVNPVANFMYVVNSKSNQVSGYQYNSATGSLTALTIASVSTGASPGAGGITSDGSLLYVPNTGGSTMSVYTVDSVTSTTGTAPTGKLTPASTPSVNLSGQPSVLLVR